MPAWFKAVPTVNWLGGGVYLIPGNIGVHSNDCFDGGALCSQVANVMWTSTVSARVQISGYVWDADVVLGRSNAFFVLLNGQTILRGDTQFSVTVPPPRGLASLSRKP